MDCICVVIGCVCGIDVNFGEDWDGWCEFEFGDGGTHGCGRCDVVLMVFVTNNQSGLSEISRKSWIFLILSGIATGASWLCYYKALQMGSATEVAAVDKLSIVFTLILAFFFLHDTFTVKSLIGCALIATGTIIMVW